MAEYVLRPPQQESTDGFILKPPEAEKPGFGANLLRGAGINARAVLEGISAIPDALVGAPLAMAAQGWQNIGEFATGRPMSSVSPPKAGKSIADAMGLPEPANGVERVVSDAASGMSGAGTIVKAGQALAKVAPKAAEFLTAQPGMQLLSGGAAGAAMGGARESGAGPLGQAAAGLAGGLIPGLGTAAATEATKRMMRGGTSGQDRMAANISAFEDSGFGTPTVAQATEGRGARAVESLLSKAPLGAGQMASKAESGAAGMGQRVTELADHLAPNASATKGGAAIDRGVKSFVERFRAEQGFLYDKLDQYIPSGSRVNVGNTKAALAELNADIPGAPALSQWFKNAKIQGIDEALTADSATKAGVGAGVSKTANELPFEALKKLRTLVGREIDDNSIVSDVPRSKWKALYAALSKDMGAAADAAGVDATKAFKRANDYSAAGYGRIESYLDRVAGKDTMERVFTAAVNPSEIKEGASTINAVMRSIPKDERRVVQAAFLKRLGNANPGAQDDIGEVFSTATFLSNWNKISPEAKRVLFADGNGQLQSNLDKIAKVASNLREGSKVFANPSGTTGAGANQIAMAGGIGAVIAGMQGQFAPAALLLGTLGITNGASRLMTNPEFVKWLARSTTAPEAALPSALNALAQSSAASDADVSDFISQARKQLPASEQTGKR